MTVDKVVNSEAIIEISFIEEVVEIVPETEAPYILDDPESPPNLPCLDDEEKVSDWSYQFPEVISESQKLTFDFDCPTLEKLF